MNLLSTARKAVLAALIAGASVISGALAAGKLTQAVVALAVTAALVAFGGVYGVSNKPA